MTVILFCLGATAALTPGASAASNTTRKSHRGQTPVPPVRQDFDTTATIAPSAKVPARTQAKSQAKTPAKTALEPADDETLPPPFRLPSASRARMRDCGVKWQAMKASGAAGDEIWRTFATGCLASKDDPLEKRSP